ncbi:MAG: cytochrome C oxidase subunit IV [Rhizobiales bacterium 12-68-15]|nr:MAG: cytochrome C oxidase subunit IV [Rhizobiales bacterium 12-68-15]
MADHGTVEYATYEEHAKTYSLFTNLAKWGTIAVVLLMVFMWFFLL